MARSLSGTVSVTVCHWPNKGPQSAPDPEFAALVKLSMLRATRPLLSPRATSPIPAMGGGPGWRVLLYGVRHVMVFPTYFPCTVQMASDAPAATALPVVSPPTITRTPPSALYASAGRLRPEGVAP